MLIVLTEMCHILFLHYSIKIPWSSARLGKVKLGIAVIGIATGTGNGCEERRWAWHCDLTFTPSDPQRLFVVLSNPTPLSVRIPSIRFCLVSSVWAAALSQLTDLSDISWRVNIYPISVAVRMGTNHCLGVKDGVKWIDLNMPKSEDDLNGS